MNEKCEVNFTTLAKELAKLAIFAASMNKNMLDVKMKTSNGKLRVKMYFSTDDWEKEDE